MVYITIEDRGGEVLLETKFVSVEAAIDYLSRHGDKYQVAIDF